MIRFADRFALEHALGSGGMARVFAKEPDNRPTAEVVRSQLHAQFHYAAATQAQPAASVGAAQAPAAPNLLGRGETRMLGPTMPGRTTRRNEGAEWKLDGSPSFQRGIIAG